VTVEDELLSERRGAAMWLTLNRPDRRNALSVELVRDLADAVEAAGQDPDVRAIVLAAQGPVFCAGGDLASLSAVAERGARAVTDVVYQQFHRLVGALSGSTVPVIAAIGGAALGAGLDLALACDLRLASAEARFASSWIGVGLVPGMGGAHLLTRAIGSTRAAEMVMLGRAIDAARALDWGLVNRVVPAGELDGAVQEITDSLAGLSPAALASSKASLWRAATLGFEQELAVLGATQGGLLTGEDFRQATERFRRGR
jgi:2-(1,2-epoxy-1,2-dihydrophenyl)acetyl-CoA isomerase